MAGRMLSEWSRVPEEEPFCDFNEDEICSNHANEREEELSWKWREAKEACEWRIWEHCSDCRDAKSGCKEWKTGPAPEEGNAFGADDEDDECLGRNGFNEPATLEERCMRMKDRQHKSEGEKVEDGAYGPEHEHEPLDELDIPHSG